MKQNIITIDIEKIHNKCNIIIKYFLILNLYYF